MVLWHETIQTFKRDVVIAEKDLMSKLSKKFPNKRTYLYSQILHNYIILAVLFLTHPFFLSVVFLVNDKFNKNLIFGYYYWSKHYLSRKNTIENEQSKKYQL